MQTILNCGPNQIEMGIIANIVEIIGFDSEGRTEGKSLDPFVVEGVELGEVFGEMVRSYSRPRSGTRCCNVVPPPADR